MYAFFISPLISQLSYDPIILSIDPIGNTAYYLEPFLPSSQRDLHVYDIRINGNLGLPLSTFVFDGQESPVYLFDSLRTRSAFQFIKGDYAFRDLSVKTQSLTLNGGTLTAFAHTRSYGGVNILIGAESLMQNYLLNYTNTFKHSNFSITSAYHNEDMDVPISNFASSAKINESYFSGLTLTHQTKLGSFSYFSDLQVSETLTDNIISETWISNQSAAFKFNPQGSFTPFLKWSQNGKNLQLYRAGVSFSDSLTQFEISITYSFQPIIELMFNKTFKNTYLKVERNILDDYTDYEQNYILNSLVLGTVINKLYFELRPTVSTSDRYSYTSYFGAFGYNSNVSIFNIKGSFYSSDTFPFSRIIMSDLKINFPYFERYTPFIKIEQNYYSQKSPVTVGAVPGTEFRGIDYSELIENVHRLNLEVGFSLETFNISYHIRNIFGEEGRFFNNYEQVPIHKYLKVEWKFRN
tara:strand:- start:1705 stop:3102 length:1398 start_codon:yes stop_codon:yes gene_type:complete